MDKKNKYCCERFEERVKEDEIRHTHADNDETEWYITSLWHLYYCPFCGEFIMGKGFGKPLQSRWKKTNKK